MGQQPTAHEYKNLTETIIGDAIQVHRELGPGLLESAYEACLAYELEQGGLKIERQKALPLKYRSSIVATAWICLSTNA